MVSTEQICRMKKFELKQLVFHLQDQESLLMKAYRDIFLKVDAANEKLKCQQDLNKFLMTKNQQLQEKILEQEISMSTGKIVAYQVEELFRQNGISSLTQLHQLVQNLSIFFNVEKKSLEAFKDTLSDKYAQILSYIKSIWS